MLANFAGPPARPDLRFEPACRSARRRCRSNRRLSSARSGCSPAATRVRPGAVPLGPCPLPFSPEPPPVPASLSKTRLRKAFAEGRRSAVEPAAENPYDNPKLRRLWDLGRAQQQAGALATPIPRLSKPDKVYPNAPMNLPVRPQRAGRRIRHATVGGPTHALAAAATLVPSRERPVTCGQASHVPVAVCGRRAGGRDRPRHRAERRRGHRHPPPVAQARAAVVDRPATPGPAVAGHRRVPPRAAPGASPRAARLWVCLHGLERRPPAGAPAAEDRHQVGRRPAAAGDPCRGLRGRSAQAHP